MTIIRITEHIEGVEDYLTHGNKKGRSLDREQLDNRVPIYGDLEVFKAANRYVQKHKKWKHNYWHITLSPAWIDHGMRRLELRQMVISTLEYYFHLYERERLAAYAEIHYPKYQSAIDLETQEVKQRLPHVHLVVSKLDLWSNNQIRILPYKKQVAEAFQAWINHQHSGNIGRQHVVEPQQVLQTVHNHQDWHRQCNAVDIGTKPYAPSSLLNSPKWQPYLNKAIENKKIYSRLKSTLADRKSSQALPSNRYSALQGFRDWLGDAPVGCTTYQTHALLNQQSSMAAILSAAEITYGLLRNHYQVFLESATQHEMAFDARTGQQYSAVNFCCDILHMSMHDAAMWLNQLGCRFDLAFFENAVVRNPNIEDEQEPNRFY